MRRRLSICYAAPGHALVRTAGSTRNILSVARELAKCGDVTVAFHSVVDDVATDAFRITSIIEGTPASGRRDGVAAVGLHARAHLSYLCCLRRFARRTAGGCDLLLEKGWRLSGFLCHEFARLGVPNALVENDVRRWAEPIRSPRAAARFAAHLGAQTVAGYYSRRVPRVICETEELVRALVERRGISADRLVVVGLGVDHELFHPRSQNEARTKLGIGADRFVLAYVGGMDVYHDLSPVLDALVRRADSEVELHLAGDGQRREEYERRARGLPAHFHGRIPHHEIPVLIAAADLCLAPYRTRAFHRAEIAFFTLKIPEYMACARPVVSVPSGHILHLIEDGVTGVLFPNEVEAWAAFLDKPPSRTSLAEMGRRAAESVHAISWRGTATRILEVCQPLVDGSTGTAARRLLGDVAP